MNKISLKDAQEKLSISRATLYRYIKEKGIETSKIKRVSFLSQDDFEMIRSETLGTDKAKETPPERHKKETVSPGSSETELRHIKEFYKEQITELKKEHKEELKAERDEKIKIAYQLGQAQSEHANTRKELLRLQQINEAPPEPEPVKKFWWQVWK